MIRLLDTNIVDDIAKRPDGRSVQAFRDLRGGDVRISVIVAAEIEYGLGANPGLRGAKAISDVLGTFDIEPLGQAIIGPYARLRRQLAETGHHLGSNDMLIAAHAMALDAVLVSADRGFRSVEGLKLENWLAPVEE